MIALILGLAIASPCSELEGGLPEGFAAANPRPGDLGSGHRLCHRDEVAGAIAGAAAIDVDDFYGLLAGGLVADGSWTATGRLALFAGIELVRYDTLISAFSDSALGPGHTWVGASYALTDSDTARTAVDGRLVLPTAVALYRNAWPFALDAGLSAELGQRVIRGHGRLGLLTSAAASKGPADPWLGGSLRLGAELRPDDHIGLVVDLDTTYGYAGRDQLEAIAVVPELRFAIRKTLGFALGGWVPVVAPERQPMGVELRVSGRIP